MKKRIAQTLAIFLVITLIAGCGGSSSTAAPAVSSGGAAPSGSESAAASVSNKEKPTSLVIASGNSGGTYYYIGAGQAKILTDNMKGFSVTTESTSGSPVENSVFASEDAGTMGILTLDGLYAALQGDKDRGFVKALDNLGLVQVGHSLILYCVTLEGKGINTIADLKGKKISLPTVGNTAYFQAVGILEQYGITLKDVSATPMVYAEAGDALKDGTLDAIFVAGGIPQATVTDLDTTKDIKLLNIEEEKVASVLKAFPYWGIQKLPAGTYSDQKEDVNVMTATVLLAANLNLDDDIVYQVAKILNEKVGDLTAIHASGADWNLENTKTVMKLGIVPVHPGAKRYYDEVK